MVEMANNLQSNSAANSLNEEYNYLECNDLSDNLHSRNTAPQVSQQKECDMVFESDEGIFEACDTAINHISNIMNVEDIPKEYSEVLNVVEGKNLLSIKL